MKKRILIINKSFAMGGIQTSLINMLECIKDFYEIDLLIYHPEGPLKKSVPDSVRVIKPSWRLEALGMSLAHCIKHGTIKQKVFRVIMTIWTKLFSNNLPATIAAKYEPKRSGYDAVITYHHEVGRHTVTGAFIQVACICTDASRRIAWVHNDSSSYQLIKDEAWNEKSYVKMDRIIACSSAVKEHFIEKHPTLGDKTFHLNNFCNAQKMIARSLEKQYVAYKNNCFICFSASRLFEIKGIERAIRAIAPILKDKRNVMWYIAGDGPNKKSIMSTIKQCGVEEYVILIGQVDNPYCYMRNADMLMVTSYYEAAPMAYSEARILGLPVFTTELASTREMLSDRNIAHICENSENGIFQGFCNMVERIPEIQAKKYAPNPNDSGCDLDVFDQTVFF